MQGIWGLASWSCKTVFSAASSAFAVYFSENLGTSCSPLTLGTFGEFPGYCRVSNSTFAQNHGGWLIRPTVPCQRKWKWRFPEMEVPQIYCALPAKMEVSWHGSTPDHLWNRWDFPSTKNHPAIGVPLISGQRRVAPAISTPSSLLNLESSSAAYRSVKIDGGEPKTRPFLA